MSWRDAIDYLSDEADIRPIGAREIGGITPIGARAVTPMRTPGAGVVEGPSGIGARAVTPMRPWGAGGMGGSGLNTTIPGLGGTTVSMRPWGARDSGGMDFAEGVLGNGWMQNMDNITNADAAKKAAEHAVPDAPNIGQASQPTHGGGGWAFLDGFDKDYATSSSASGVPANFIKAIQRMETGGQDWNGKENCDRHGQVDCVALNSGVFRSTATAYGMDYDRLKNDQGYAIQAIGRTLQEIAASDTADWGGPGGNVLETGGWELVAKLYHSGPNVYKPGWTDENGVSPDEYAAGVNNYYNQLGAQQAAPGSGGGQTVSSPNNPASGHVGNFSGSAIADLADDYTGVNYVWGGIPTQDQDPYATGWDCSGFVWFIMDKLGYAHTDMAGGVPQGSHPQAQWAIDNGRWRDGLDLSQMQPGDLIFFETGPRVGGGVDQVSPKAQAATHVGIYLGDGKMINAMQSCEDLGSTAQPGVNCGTGIVAIEDGYWDAHAVGWADTSDIIGSAAVQASGTTRGGQAPANITGQGAASTAPVSTPAPSGTLPIQNGYGSTGNVR